jgi:hypothetical protein
MLKKNVRMISSPIRWLFNRNELEVQSELGTCPTRSWENERFDGRFNLGGLLGEL